MLKQFALLLFFINILFCQEPSESYFYSGMIGEKYPIRMRLEIQKEEITGDYFYLSTGESIYISGSIRNDKFNLKEEVQEKVTGLFSGSFLNNRKQISGEWSKPDGSKKLSLQCELEAIGKELKSKDFNINVSYPFLMKDIIPYKNQLNDSISLIMKTNYNNYLAEAKEFYNEETDEEIKKDIKEKYTWECDASFSHISKNIAAISFSVYQYSGGAHPNTWYYAINFDMRNSKFKRIPLFDLFRLNSNFEKTLSDLIIKELKKKGASNIVNNEITDFIEDIKKDNLHFVILPKGLRFDFSPYAVASYAEGNFSVLIQYDKLKNYIDYNGILSEFK